MHVVLGKCILQIVGDLVEILISICCNNKAEMCPNKMSTITGNFFLYCLDIINANLVAGVRNGSMVVHLLVQMCHNSSLIRYKKDLVVYNGIGVYNMINTAQQIFRRYNIVNSHY